MTKTPIEAQLKIRSGPAIKPVCLGNKVIEGKYLLHRDSPQRPHLRRDNRFDSHEWRPRNERIADR